MPNPIGCSVGFDAERIVPELQLRDVLEIQHEHHLALELRIHRDEIAGAVHAAAVMAAAGHEQQRALGLIRGLREVPRQRDRAPRGRRRCRRPHRTSRRRAR